MTAEPFALCVYIVIEVEVASFCFISNNRSLVSKASKTYVNSTTKLRPRRKPDHLSISRLYLQYFEHTPLGAFKKVILVALSEVFKEETIRRQDCRW